MTPVTMQFNKIVSNEVKGNSATRSILWEKKQRIWPVHMPRTPQKKIVFEPTEIQTITFYLTVSGFNIVVFLIELELLTPV